MRIKLGSITWTFAFVFRCERMSWCSRLQEVRWWVWTSQRRRGEQSLTNTSQIRWTDFRSHYISGLCWLLVIWSSKLDTLVGNNHSWQHQIKSGLYNKSFRHRFEVVYLDNIVGPGYRWVWVLECWKFFPGLLTYVTTWGWRQFLIWGHFILRPEAAWNCLRSCELQTKYNL